MRMNNKEEGEWRMVILKRDDFTCHFCGHRPSRVVHHINSKKFYPDLKYDIGNGICVCEKCHSKYHEGNKVENNIQEKPIDTMNTILDSILIQYEVLEKIDNELDEIKKLKEEVEK